jgi:pilus assembly protein CpaB
MDRRRILLVAAVVVAMMGGVLVWLYAQGANSRAEDKFDTVDVLKATQVIEIGESIDDAQTAGKLTLAKVTVEEKLANALSDTAAIAGDKAMQTIYPGEQIVTDKFADNVAAGSSLPFTDDTKIAMSVNLTDPSRVAGFVNPGSEVAIFMTGTDVKDGTPFSRLLLDRVTVMGVGNTTPVSTTTTDETGASTTEQLPRTLLTISVDQRQMEKVLFAQANGELAFGLLTENSDVKADTSPMTVDELWK